MHSHLNKQKIVESRQDRNEVQTTAKNMRKLMIPKHLFARSSFITCRFTAMTGCWLVLQWSLHLCELMSPRVRLTPVL